MIRCTLAAVTAIVLAVGFIGCSGPCDELADKTCRQLGENDELCHKLRAIAASPRHGEAQACEAGNTFVHELRKAR